MQREIFTKKWQGSISVLMLLTMTSTLKTGRYSNGIFKRLMPLLISHFTSQAAKQEKIDRGKKGLNAIVEYIRENREEFLQSCQEQEKKPYPNGLTKEMLFADNWD